MQPTFLSRVARVAATNVCLPNSHPWHIFICMISVNWFGWNIFLWKFVLEESWRFYQERMHPTSLSRVARVAATNVCLPSSHPWHIFICMISVNWFGWYIFLWKFVLEESWRFYEERMQPTFLSGVARVAATNVCLPNSHPCTSIHIFLFAWWPFNWFSKAACKIEATESF